MLSNIKFMKEYFDSSDYDRQPLYLFLTYLIYVVSFIIGIIVGFKYQIPYVFSFLKGIVSSSENKGIFTLLLPYIVQVFLVVGLIVTLLSKLLIEPICKYTFRNKK